jgi:hypothetical protein
LVSAARVDALDASNAAIANAYVVFFILLLPLNYCALSYLSASRAMIR